MTQTSRRDQYSLRNHDTQPADDELTDFLQQLLEQSPDDFVPVSREILLQVISRLRTGQADLNPAEQELPQVISTQATPKNLSTELPTGDLTAENLALVREAANETIRLCVGANIQVFQNQAFSAERQLLGQEFKIRVVGPSESEKWERRLFRRMLRIYDDFMGLRGQQTYWEHFARDKSFTELEDGFVILITRLGQYAVINCFGQCVPDNLGRRKNDIAFQLVLSEEKVTRVVKFLEAQPRVFPDVFFNTLIPDFIQEKGYGNKNPFRLPAKPGDSYIKKVVGFYDLRELTGLNPKITKELTRDFTLEW